MVESDRVGFFSDELDRVNRVGWPMIRSTTANRLASRSAGQQNCITKWPRRAVWVVNGKPNKLVCPHVLVGSSGPFVTRHLRPPRGGIQTEKRTGLECKSTRQQGDHMATPQIDCKKKEYDYSIYLLPPVWKYLLFWTKYQSIIKTL